MARVSVRPKSFDAVLLVDVLEHLDRADGESLLAKAETWAEKRVIVKSPNGFFRQGALGDNPFQMHRSGWTVADLKSRRYRAFGMAGWKRIRSEGDDASGDEDSVCRTIRWKPRAFWLGVSAISQIVTYFFPNQAFEVLYVRDLA
jgi:hypothetical protein